MKHAIIHNTDKFNVTSFGNGLAYSLTDKTRIGSEPCEIFFQGDAAIDFEAEIERGERVGFSYNQIFSILFDEYQAIAQHNEANQEG